MRCKQCGEEVPEGAAFCSMCGQRAGEDMETPAGPARDRELEAARPPVKYAGFWLRAIAYVVDCLLLGFVAGITILQPLLRHAGVAQENPWTLFRDTSRQVLAINLLMVMVSWLYWALLESSPWQATIGKRLLGLYVTDMQGNRITFARASGRYFGKIVSSVTLMIGYLMAGFTEKKQALHDMMASCLVLKKT